MTTPSSHAPFVHLQCVVVEDSNCAVSAARQQSGKIENRRRTMVGAILTQQQVPQANQLTPPFLDESTIFVVKIVVRALSVGGSHSGAVEKFRFRGPHGAVVFILRPDLHQAVGRCRHANEFGLLICQR